MLSISFKPSGKRFGRFILVFHVRSLGRVFICIFCHICIFSGTLSDVRGDNPGTGTPESETMLCAPYQNDIEHHIAQTRDIPLSLLMLPGTCDIQFQFTKGGLF